MALDLDKINEFFKNYETQKNLPAEIAQTVVNGNSLKYGGLELTVENKDKLHSDLVELLKSSNAVGQMNSVYVLHMKNGDFVLYDFPSGRRVEYPQSVWNNATIHSVVKKYKLAKKYSSVLRELEKVAVDFFAYPGSAGMQSSTSFNDAYKNITDNEDVIEKMVNLAIVPRIEVGSRSQSNKTFSTNFCLDTFKEVGITDASQMITLAEAGITPFHLEHFKSAGRKVQRKRNDLVEAVKDFYGKNFVPAKEVVNDLYRNHTDTYNIDPKKRNNPIAGWETAFAQTLCGD